MTRREFITITVSIPCIAAESGHLCPSGVDSVDKVPDERVEALY